jgi:prepilin-type N-terminal cleavage/methylation domain-containing protein
MKPTKGLTLIELMVVLVIFLGIMGALLTSFLVSKKSFLSSDAYIRVQEQARRVLDTMVKELRESGNVDSSVTNPNEDFSDENRLNIQIARSYDSDTCGGICWGNDSADDGWIHYLLDNERLMRCQSDASDTVIADFSACRVVATDIGLFEVDYDDSDQTVTVRIQAEITSDQLPGGNMSTTPAPLQTQVRLRNDS